MLENIKSLANEAGTMPASSPKQTPKDMPKLIEWYNSLTEVTIKDIIEFHARFEKIHPFQDGNGRVGRILHVLKKENSSNKRIKLLLLKLNRIILRIFLLT